MEVTGREAVKAYVGMGLGISILNEYYLDDGDKKRLFVRNVSDHFGQAKRGILLKKSGYHSTFATEFVNILLGHFRVRKVNPGQQKTP